MMIMVRGMVVLAALPQLLQHQQTILAAQTPPLQDVMRAVQSAIIVGISPVIPPHHQTAAVAAVTLMLDTLLQQPLAALVDDLPLVGIRLLQHPCLMQQQLPPAMTRPPVVTRKHSQSEGLLLLLFQGLKLHCCLAMLAHQR